MVTVLKYWLLMAALITGTIWLSYGMVQQDLRQSADDPQIQLAEDGAAHLNAGQQVQDVVPAEKVDIAHSLAPYVMVFDASGKPIAASAQLDGQAPTIPSGIFDTVRQRGEDRVSWQPQTDVRSALVVTQYRGGFVAAGRSLREIENREGNIQQIALLGWIILLAGSLAGTVLVRWDQLKRHPNAQKQ